MTLCPPIWRTRRICTAAAFVALMLTASTASALDPPHDMSQPSFSEGCLTCHAVHSAYGTLLGTPDAIENLCSSCHYAGGPAPEMTTHQSLSCVACHDPHAQRQDRANGSSYGKLLRASITTPSSGSKPIVLMQPRGSQSFADGDSIYDGVCEVCHTATAYHRNAPPTDQSHYPAVRCTACHQHSTGFEPGSPAGSHSVHINADPRGPEITCSDCHDVADYPNFKSGTDSNGDNKFNKAETDVCDTCHSPDGSYNGVDSQGDSVGGKDNWDDQVYAGTTTLQAGKEKWCAGCHDEEPANSKADASGTNAPNVIGDEDGGFPYGFGWGFYKTGHGLNSSFPTTKAPAAGLECDDCHDNSKTHLDHEHRTYYAGGTGGNTYQEGYRLEDVNGGAPMEIPRITGGLNPIDPDDFALCFQCHTETSRYISSAMTTNFREQYPTGEDTVKNSHFTHLDAGYGWANRWDSDWNGQSTDCATYGNCNYNADSYISCPACHNVHGSPSPAMGRHGELISTAGTQDKVPGFDLIYTSESESNPVRMDSNGGQLTNPPTGAGTVATNGICAMCHSTMPAYKRDPIDFYPPKIWAVFGRVGGDRLRVLFTEPVYGDTGGTGAVVPGDLALVSDGRSILSSSHTAGDECATLVVSSALEGEGDIGVDTLAAASATSIYDLYDVAMSDVPVVISGDDTGPLVADLQPPNDDTDVPVSNGLSFTLSDSHSGVDWSTFSITLENGEQTYLETYTHLDTDAVSQTGSFARYEVTIDPRVDFPDGEPITVTVNAEDFVGNAVVPSSWTFTTAPAANALPVLSWTRQLVAYALDGAKPTHGEIDTTFEFRVTYTDAQAPSYVRLVLDGTPYDMNEYDPGDTTYNDGKVYTLSLVLDTAGTFDYHFEAHDGTGPATGAPATDSSLEVITAANALNVDGVEYSTISAAITAYQPGDTILVHPGTYTGLVQIMNKEVVLRSLDDPENTTLTNENNLVVSIGNGYSSILDGFTVDGLDGSGAGIEINNTQALVENCIITRNNGGGIKVYNPASVVTVDNTTFSYNSTSNGGAINMISSGVPLTVTDSSFVGNTATGNGGAIYISSGEPTVLTRCVFDQNSAPQGGALHLGGTGTVMVEDSLLTTNSATNTGGAIDGRSSSTWYLTRSVLAGNWAPTGGAMYNASNTTILTNTTFSGNKATTGNGGALFFSWVSSVNIMNCTFSGNEGETGGAIHLDGASGKNVTNSILYGDHARTGDKHEIGAVNGTPNVTYCDIDQSEYWSSGNNFSSDPYFLDPRGYSLAPTDEGDYHIDWNSGAIDQGTSSGAPGDDIDGQSRPGGGSGGYDVGSDEFVSP